jgi:hypothetical protein
MPSPGYLDGRNASSTVQAAIVTAMAGIVGTDDADVHSLDRNQREK